MSTLDYANGGIPKTIEELKDYCERNGFTSSKTRFFIDYDYSGAKAFGIYKDEATGEFVVYKNKADGTRVVRYRGTDEEFAVVELYDRLQSEIANQKLQYAADMAERERNKYERGSSGGSSPYDSIKNFNISDYPVQSGLSSLGGYDDYESHSSYDSGHRSGGRRQLDPLSLAFCIIVIVIVLLSCFTDRGRSSSGGHSYRSSYSSYDDNWRSYDNDYDYDSGWSSYDSDWSSDSWDSDYTDWDSDW